MRCLTSEDDITNLNGTIQVHVVKSKDRFQNAFCFISSVNRKKCILQYTTESPRGPIACLVPEVKDGEINWGTRGVIKIFNEYKENDWCDTTYCMDISQEQFYRYQQWLIPWLKKNKVYSIFEGDSTIRTFMADSFNYFCKTLIDRVQSRAPLFLPEVDTYSISFESKERISAVGVPDVISWYSILHYSNENVTIYQAVRNINKEENIYLRDVEAGRSRYYLIRSPKIELHTAKIPTPKGLLPAMIEDNKPLRSNRSKLFNIADHTSSRTVRESLSDSSIEIRDEDIADTIAITGIHNDSYDDTIIINNNRYEKTHIPLLNRVRKRRTIVEESDSEEDKVVGITTDSDVPVKTTKKRLASSKILVEQPVPARANVTAQGIILAATPCPNINPITPAGGCVVPDLPDSNGIGIIIVFVTILIIFIIIFVVIYIYSEDRAYVQEQPYGLPIGYETQPSPGYIAPGLYPA